MNNAGYACLRGAKRGFSIRAPLITGALLLSLAAYGRQAASSASEQVILLQYSEQITSVVNWGANLRLQTAPFQKEPDLAGRQVSRGFMRVGKGADQELPFIWDYSRQALYLDLNRNQDFTDDPNGTFRANKSQAYAYNQTFTNVSFSLKDGELQRRYLADFMLYRYNPSNLRATIALRSFYSGKAVLNGREWQLGVCETLAENRAAPSGGDEPHQLLLRPWDNRATPWGAQGVSLESFAFPRNLYFGGQGYRVESKWVTSGAGAACQLTLKERPAELGAAKLSGKFIQRVVLVPAFSRQGLAAYTVVLDRPGTDVQLPLGTYDRQLVTLEAGGVKAYRDTFQTYGAGQVALVVNADKPVTLAAGGPLTNTVSAQRRGRNLSLSYRLQGADGTSYLLTGQDRSKPPSFAVTKNGQLLHSGKFQFG